MPEWLVQLTQPQATLANGALTFLGAIAGVLVGWYLFSGKVKDIKTALENTEKILLEHKENVKKTLIEIEQRIAGLAATTQEIRADAADRSDEINAKTVVSAGLDASTAVGLVGVDTIEVDQSIRFQELRENWAVIRNRLETIAADPMIDGRTTAKYARLDRRSYLNLVEALIKDNRLNGFNDEFRAAAKLWAAHRNQRSPVSDANAKLMKEYADLLGATE